MVLKISLPSYLFLVVATTHVEQDRSVIVGGNRRRDEKNDFFVPSAAPPTVLGYHWKALGTAVASSSHY